MTNRLQPTGDVPRKNSDGDVHLWVRDIKEGIDVRDSYLVKEKNLGTTRRGEPFLSLVIADRTGEIQAKVWEEAEALSSLFGEGDVIKIRARAGSFRGQLQMTVSDLEVSKKIDPSLFMETSPRDIEEMVKSLRKILNRINNVHLKSLIDRFLADHKFMSQFKSAPAAKRFHHSYLGGLLEHTLSVCQLAVLVCEHYHELDKDLLVVAAFLHDIGKTKEMRWDFLIEYTDQGRLLGHITLGSMMLDEKLAMIREFPQDLAVRLRHLILSHHGVYEFGSPKRPKFLEAFALHLIDDLDAKIVGLGDYMKRDKNEGAWTGYHHLFERFFLKGGIIATLEGESDKQRRLEEKQRTLFP